MQEQSHVRMCDWGDVVPIERRGVSRPVSLSLFRLAGPLLWVWQLMGRCSSPLACFSQPLLYIFNSSLSTAPPQLNLVQLQAFRASLLSNIQLIKKSINNTISIHLSIGCTLVLLIPLCYSALSTFLYLLFDSSPEVTASGIRVESSLFALDCSPRQDQGPRAP